MSTTAITTSSTTLGDNITLSAGENIFIAPGVTCVSTGANALAAWNKGHRIQILGTLAGGGNAGLNLGVGSAGITNSVVMIGNTGAVTGDWCGVATSGKFVSVVNDGLIQGGSTGLQHWGGAGFDFVNTGTVIGTGHAVQVFSDNGRIVNYGTMIGGDTGVGLVNDGGMGAAPMFDNYGTISAGNIAVEGDATVSNNFRNFGEIHGWVKGGGGDDTILNTGLIVGNVLLSGGNDTLDSRTGTIRGLIDAGLGADTILTGNEDNHIDGGQGADTMAGGNGDDTYIVDNSADVIIETPGAGYDAVQSSISYSLADNVEQLTLSGTAATNGTGNALANVINGNSAANILSGGAGNDVLWGGDGNDKLFGGAGNDRLTGGNNNDIFVFNTLPNSSTNRDTIVDFSHVDDTIQLENAIFKGMGSGVLKSAYFFAGTKAHDANDHIIYNKATGALYYDSDGTGSHAQVLFAIISNHSTAGLTYNDFVLI